MRISDWSSDVCSSDLRTHAPDRHCRAVTFRRVDIEQNRLTHRNQGSTENALQQAEDHKLAKVRSDPTQPRCKGEANARELDETLTAATPCQPAGERRNDSGNHGVEGRHPGYMNLRPPKASQK